MTALAGGCHCGRIRYRATGMPRHETICHCVDCRRVAGAASVAWFTVDADGFAFVAGEPVRYASSEGVERTHCGACGTTLTYRNVADALDVTIASLDDPDLLPPRDHTRVAGAPRWDRPCDGLPERSVSAND